jgi:hypothetical protein
LLERGARLPFRRAARTPCTCSPQRSRKPR